MKYEILRIICESLDLTDGVTIQVNTGEQPPQGWVVSPYKSREAITKERPGSYYINSYALDNMDKLFAADHSLSIWYDAEEDHWVLDVVVVTRNLGHAMRLGRINDQKEIWDVVAGKRISVVQPQLSSIGTTLSGPAGGLVGGVARQIPPAATSLPCGNGEHVDVILNPDRES